MQETRADRIARIAWNRGDQRSRCVPEAHLMCDHCRVCACSGPDELDPTEYPTGRVRVTTDKNGRTLCRECRYQETNYGRGYW